MRKRCLICGNKLNENSGECINLKCPFKDPTNEIQKQLNESQENGKNED